MGGASEDKKLGRRMDGGESLPCVSRCYCRVVEETKSAAAVLRPVPKVRCRDGASGASVVAGRSTGDEDHTVGLSHDVIHG